MSFIYDFSDNVSIDADALNAIAANIGENTAVSSNFSDNVSYAVNKLNAIRSDIVNPGIVFGMECCAENDTVSISPGVAFFKNGMRLEITETETFSLLGLNDAYVYLYASESYNCAMPILTAEEKNSDAYLPVAEIDEYGNVSDTRRFSTSKIPLVSGSAVQKIELSYNTYANGASLVSCNRKTHTVNIKDKYFSYIIFDAKISGKKENTNPQSIAINGYFKRDGTKENGGICYGICGGKACVGTSYIGTNYSINCGTYLKPVWEDNTLVIYTDCDNNIGTFDICMEVI